MSSVSALECKQHGNVIKDFVSDTWNRSAKHLCKPGIEAKFLQNCGLMETPVYETGGKTIVEGTKDDVWGSGQRLDSVHCLDQSKWILQGIMGKILSEIREAYWSSTRPTNTDYNTIQPMQLSIPSFPPQGLYPGSLPICQHQVPYQRLPMQYQHQGNYPVVHPHNHAVPCIGDQQPNRLSMQPLPLAPSSQIPLSMDHPGT